MTTPRWQTAEFQLTAELLITARFLVAAGKVLEFQVVLHLADGTDAWLVRYETHGGHPHKHLRWDNAGERRHRQLKGWPKDHAGILNRAIRDMKENGQAYQGRYDAWRRLQNSG